MLSIPPSGKEQQMGGRNVDVVCRMVVQCSGGGRLMEGRRRTVGKKE